MASGFRSLRVAVRTVRKSSIREIGTLLRQGLARATCTGAFAGPRLGKVGRSLGQEHGGEAGFNSRAVRNRVLVANLRLAEESAQIVRTGARVGLQPSVMGARRCHAAPRSGGYGIHTSWSAGKAKKRAARTPPPQCRRQNAFGTIEGGGWNAMDLGGRRGARRGCRRPPKSLAFLEGVSLSWYARLLLQRGPDGVHDATEISDMEYVYGHPHQERQGLGRPTVPVVRLPAAVQVHGVPSSPLVAARRLAPPSARGRRPRGTVREPFAKVGNAGC